jgi:hypothetical protein
MRPGRPSGLKYDVARVELLGFGFNATGLTLAPGVLTQAIAIAATNSLVHL